MSADSEVDVNTIPSAMRNRDQWVGWSYQSRSDTKPAKIPLNPQNANRADPTASDTWGSYSEVRASLDVDGVGFVFTDEDPYVGVDLDDCVDEDGTIDRWAQAIVDQLDSYTEYSPSGTGLHIISRGDIPGAKNRRHNIEMYDQDRYFTVTGNHLSETPVAIESRQDAVEAVYEKHLETDSEKSDATKDKDERSASPSSGSLSHSDEDLIEKARTANNGDKFTRLWNGNTSGFKSHSEADSALCCQLAFWTGGDRERIDRLFRRSDLMREKWDKSRGDQTYGEITIDNALAATTNHYDPTSMMNTSDSYRQRRRTEQSTDPATTEQASGTPTIDDVKQVVIEEFDEQTWYATEAVLSAHSTLLLSDSTGAGLVIVGPSSSGKTTVLEFLEELDDMVYRSDDVTPASFVSHDASKGDDELAEIDLLPKIKQKTLLSRDLATWFAGEQEDIHKRMSVMTNLLDGKGYTRDTGTHGQRGYTGREYRFNFIGATTPLDPRAWHVMGNVGARLVFYEKSGGTDVDSVVDDLIDGGDYHKKIARCRTAVGDFLQEVWENTGGYASVDDVSPASNESREFLTYLIELVRHGRAIVENGSLRLEGSYRIGSTLLDIAQARAILGDRREFTAEDMQVCSRVALSTMPEKRRPLVRGLLDPENQGSLVASDIEQITGVSRPTAHTRMELLDRLKFGHLNEPAEDDQGKKTVTIRSEFEWPESIPFPGL